MTSMPRAFATAVAALAVLTVGMAGPVEGATKAKEYKNCTELNKKYPHGVGKKGAKDKVSGSSRPVTNFKVDTALYNANKKSDRDKDGVACEKR